MTYETLENFHSKMANTSKYSEHNKKVFDDYCEWASNQNGDLKDSTIKKYMSRWYSVGELVDFKLDEAERKEVTELISSINNDEVTKKYGGKYSTAAKKKFINGITSFYNKFIDRKDMGYAKELDGPLLVARLTYTDRPSNKVDTDTKPNAEDIREIAKVPDNLRGRAAILFMFATGARIGEIFPTDDKPEYLRWDDITFGQDDTMKVELRKNYKKDEPERRELNLIIGKPMMKKLREKQNPDLDDPVFPQKDRRMFCPECSTKATQSNNATHERRKYECEECGWTGTTRECVRKKMPVSGSQIRKNVIKPAVQSADVTPKAEEKEMDDTPHKLTRKSRALHLQARNWGDSPLRDFFGWEEGSPVPGRYKDALNVNQKQELARTHPNADVSVDGYFLSKALDPVDCSNCGKRNSRLWDTCEDCEKPISYEGLVSTKPSPESQVNEIKHEAKDQVIMEQAEDIQKAQEKLEKAMKNQLEEKEII